MNTINTSIDSDYMRIGATGLQEKTSLPHQGIKIFISMIFHYVNLIIVYTYGIMDWMTLQ